MTASFGFIFPRCVREERHNLVWKECYRCIRRIYPDAPIVIIDDGSIPDVLNEDGIELTHTTIEASEFPGAGEMLPYIYFHKHRPWEKAVILNDSMLVQNPLPIHDTDRIMFLWDFGSFIGIDILIDYPYECYAMLALLKDPGKPKTIMSGSWKGCFATASIISWEFLDLLQKTHGFLDIVEMINSRPYRCSLERVFALCVQCHVYPVPTVQGDIHYFLHRISRPWGYAIEHYMHDKANNEPFIAGSTIIKVWNGR